jgi:hypothetical protein
MELSSLFLFGSFSPTNRRPTGFALIVQQPPDSIPRFFNQQPALAFPACARPFEYVGKLANRRCVGQLCARDEHSLNNVKRIPNGHPTPSLALQQ